MCVRPFHFILTFKFSFFCRSIVTIFVCIAVPFVTVYIQCVVHIQFISFLCSILDMLRIFRSRETLCIRTKVAYHSSHSANMREYSFLLHVHVVQSTHAQRCTFEKKRKHVWVTQFTYTYTHTPSIHPTIHQEFNVFFSFDSIVWLYSLAILMSLTNKFEWEKSEKTGSHIMLIVTVNLLPKNCMRPHIFIIFFFCWRCLFKYTVLVFDFKFFI